MHIFRYGTTLLFLAAALPAEAQYRRQVEELPPAYALEFSIGALFPFEETTSPVETPRPDLIRRGRRDVGTSPYVALSARYGRGLAIYASVAAAFAGNAELSGTDPLTGELLSGETEVGTIGVGSVGVSFAPLRDVSGLRLELGPAWVDLGTGGSYLAVRGSAAATFLSIGDNGGVFLGWDGYFAGGQYDRGEVEYQVRGGLIWGARAGFAYAW